MFRTRSARRWIKIRSILISLFLVSASLVLFHAQSVLAQEMEDGNVVQEIVDQRSINEFACGPCCIVNSITHSEPGAGLTVQHLDGESGAEKARFIIDRYGSRASASHDDSVRINGRFTGMSPEDLVLTFNEILDDGGCEMNVAGAFLNRRPDESIQGNLTRVHSLIRGALDAGLPPLFSVRAFVARQKEGDSAPLWHALTTHYVVIDSVQDELRPNESAFSFQYLDSFTGQRELGYIYAEEARNFTAAMGDAEHWEWLNNRPFPLVLSPSLRLKTQEQEFQARTIITANFLVMPAEVLQASGSQYFDTLVEISCGQCQFEMEGDGCDLAIRYQDRIYRVDGTNIDAHGDAHAADGFCNCIRKARVSGMITDSGRFELSDLLLLPYEPPAEDSGAGGR